MKDPWFMANTLFLKSSKRIMALMMIMTLCLAVYGALEYRIRKALARTKKHFPINTAGLRRNQRRGGCFSSFPEFMSWAVVAEEKSYCTATSIIKN